LGLGLAQEIGNVAEEPKSINPDLEQYILSMIEQRKQAKLNKDYKLADEIRNELTQKGIELIDTKEGTVYKIK
jgi:cysteinyl-tRNA synthetase